jgi:6,7-dimethyl-8-ribityllumazine synthase
MSEEQERAVAESEEVQKLLDTPLRMVYARIISMIGVATWDQHFVSGLLDGFEQCLKALDADYDTIDLLTSYYRMKLEAEG